MSGKSKFVDYEPLSRPKRSRPKADISLEPFRPTKSKAAEPAPDHFAERSATPPAASAIESTTLKPWIKRGHGASYLGIFLFTILVFLRPYELLPSLSWLSKGAFWTALITLLIFIPTQLGLESNLTYRPREVNLVLLLLVVAALSIPLATDPGRAMNSIIDYIKVVMMFIVMINVLRSDGRLKAILLLVLSISFFLAIVAINDYRLGNLGLQGMRIEGVIGGLFENPNDLALHLVTMVPLAGALFLVSRNPVGKLFYALCFVLMIGACVATFSRGGFIGLMASLGVIAWRLAGRNRSMLVVALPILLVLFFALAPGGYGARVFSGSQDNGSASARMDDLKRSLFVAARHPVLGVGFDNYAIYSNRNLATHNAYTQVASEIGLGGLILYVMFILTPLGQLRQIERETIEQKGRYFYLSLGLEASIVGYMVCSFFASVAFLWYLYYLVAYGICVRRLYEVDTNKKLVVEKKKRPADVS
jgi:Lipid A core - O-antigen ligase and related enzymes